MKMFHWPSEALKNYARGTIVAIGRDLAEARANARAGFRDIMVEKLSFGFMLEKWPDWALDEDDQEQALTLLMALEADILKEPAEGTVLFISGGE